MSFQDKEMVLLSSQSDYFTANSVQEVSRYHVTYLLPPSAHHLLKTQNLQKEKKINKVVLTYTQPEEQISEPWTNSGWKGHLG